MDTGLLRVSVVSSARRVDLALPAAVPVAELVPELVRALGLTDGGDGFSLRTVTGHRLAPGAGLAGHVTEGCLLVLAPGVGPPPPVVHDDPAEAMAEAVQGELAPRPGGFGRTVAVGTACLLAAAAGGTALRGLDTTAPGLARGLVALVAFLVLAATASPRWLPRAVGGPAPLGPVDVARLQRDAQAAHALLLGIVIGAGTLLVAVAPLAVGLGAWGGLLVVDAAGLLALRTRHHHSVAEVTAGLVAALATVVVAVTVAGGEHPQWRQPIAVAAAIVAALTAVGALVRGSARRIRAAELLEAAVVVALLPLAAGATGLLAWAHGAAP